MKMRLLIIQFGGDYRKAFQLVYTDGVETYHGQKYVLDTVLRISEQIDEVILLCCKTTQAYNIKITKGLRVIGAGVDPYKQVSEIFKIIETHKPTHLVVHFPIPEIFRFCIQNRIKTIALLADSFLRTGLRRQYKNYLLARILNHPQIDWIGNHNVNASFSLQQIGVNPHKIIPYDWTHTVTPELFGAKQLQNPGDNRKLVYVGLITESKGVGDILDALAILRNKNFPVTLQIAGGGETDKFINHAERLGIRDHVNFLGLVPNDLVIKLMRDADIVVIPSWHEYPEACPFTIYEAFCTYTPLVASNHPMFQGNLQHKVNAMIYPARNPKKLAECITELLEQPSLYAKLSAASKIAWQRLQVPMKWADLIEKWLYNSSANHACLSRHSLASSYYNYRVPTA
ncbi:putative hexosyltransferase [Calothrix sp. NIES-4071]|nr:putative hexosyltransferase [Calothrix sp. NIES-4071]BAZ55834.1 putative hexosyltransferase [Calothrix sp. NIES-4105]